MAILHRDRTDTTADDAVAGPGETRTERPVVVRKGSFGATVRTVLATLLLVAVVLVAAANTDDVEVDLLFETYQVALSLLVAATAAAGFLIGLLAGARRRRRTV